jgi:hypothetical protein
VTLGSHVDHLVFAARTLDEGVAWCRDTLGIAPTGGGEHALMGTHNRVFRIDSPGFERACFEIIAVNPAATAPGRTRWFDLDDERMRSTLAQGPRLIHFVASTDNVDAAVAALAARGIDRGAAVAASRGNLRWRITVRPDGQRLFDGALPTLIQWDGAHPGDTLPESGVTLQSLELWHPNADALTKACDAIGLARVELRTGEANIVATLAAPNGRVRLESAGA